MRNELVKRHNPKVDLAMLLLKFKSKVLKPIFKSQRNFFAAAENCTDEFAIANACKLLKLNDKGAITLWNRHPSGVKDNATALDNIRDACNGKAASRSK